jgi:hypothetical protein
MLERNSAGYSRHSCLQRSQTGRVRKRRASPTVGRGKRDVKRPQIRCWRRIILSVTICRERSLRGLRKQHHKPSYLERRSRGGCHLRLTCHDEPYYMAFDYSAPGSCLSNEGLTDVLDHGSHGNDCNGRAQTQRAQTHFLIDSVF